MILKADTKIVTTGGSLRTTVPKKIAEALKLKEGACIHWELKATEGGIIVTIAPRDTN